MVLAINMMDEAKRQGIHLDGEKLSEILGVPVLPMVASRGQGIRETFVQTLHVAQEKILPSPHTYGEEIEKSILELKNRLEHGEYPVSRRAIIVKLLEGDPFLTEQVGRKIPEIGDVIQKQIDKLCHKTSRQAVWLVATERQNTAREMEKQVLTQKKTQLTLRDHLDDYLLHPFWGYVFLLLVMGLFFYGVYGFGSWLEAPLLNFFDSFDAWIKSILPVSGLLAQVISGTIQGFSGGLAIVLPYLVPFLVGLGFLEDIGYLTRIAFLMDTLMHRMGLHGKAIVPFILGYGCNVPAIMSTRIMEDKRDRFLSAALSTMVPCAARLSVIFGLVAFYVGPWAALGIYFYNLFVIALTGRIITRFLPEDSPGLILEMPVYRLPTLKTVTSKAWFRIREFVFEAWPILILGSIVLAIMNHYSITGYIDALTRPLNWLLGLPEEVGTPLIFGIFRKELSLIMLAQAFGTTDFSSVMSAGQMVVFTVFVVFYIPCLATMIAIRNELGNKAMWLITGLTVIVATLAALVARLVILIF